MDKQTSELKDLDVDRVDGVDRPATGRNFLLFKNEAGADAVLKSLGMVSTAASIALSKIRADKRCTVSRSSAVALNGLAQILSESPVFVGKASCPVPTQPYECRELSQDDADKRGPADENLGPNFVARSIGSVTLKMKDDEKDGDVPENFKAKGRRDDLYPNEMGYLPGDRQSDRMGGFRDEFRTKAAAAAAEKAEGKGECSTDDEDILPAELRGRGVAARMAKMETTVEKLAAVVLKAIEGPGAPVQVSKDEGDEDEPQPVKKTVARSKQIEQDEPQPVKKNSDLRMGVSFASHVFGK